MSATPSFFPQNALLIGTLLAAALPLPQASAFDDKPLQSFFNKHCYECHDDNSSKGDLDLYDLSTDLSDPAVMEKWVRLYDRVHKGEMPPDEQPLPDEAEKQNFAGMLAAPLTQAHQLEKGTVLRRLNRHEYENTMNDIFGTHLNLADTLPEDARSHEFENVGSALGLSRVQLQGYLDSATTVLDAAIAATVEKPEAEIITASYTESDELEKFFGNQWLKRPDGAVVFFQDDRYPTGTLRAASAKKDGFYKIRVTGYAYQSEQPVTFAINGDTFARGAERPTYAYRSFAPGEPQTVEIDAWVGERYMIQIKPWGIYDPNYDIKNKGVENFTGPGLAIQKIEIEGPLVDEFPSRGHQLLFTGLDRREIEPSNPDTKNQSWYQAKFEIPLPAEQPPSVAALPTLQRVATKAFRRPVRADQLSAYVALLESELALGTTFEDALRTAVTAILCSPDFIFFKEDTGWLDNFALASRLSYFLTRSAPDEQLMAAAIDGSLRKNPEVLLTQTERLLQSPHFDRFVDDFTDAWLNLRDIDFTAPDQTLFPEFDAFLQWSMIKESRTFFHQLIKENHSATAIVRSDFAMLNNRLAKHYGLEALDVNGPELRPVALPADSVRGGVLSQGSVLKVSANGTNTSPVVRGVFVMERILGETPSPPPAGISGVEPDIRGASTLRQILDQHRDSESCQSCHEAIDPPGFALESFNPVGTWRDHFRSLGEGEKLDDLVNGRRVHYKKGPAVDATGHTADGQTFQNFNEFRSILAAHPEQITRTMVSKLLTFASGREMGFSDRPEIERIVADAAKTDYGMRDILRLVVASEIFRRK